MIPRALVLTIQSLHQGSGKQYAAALCQFELHQVVPSAAGQNNLLAVSDESSRLRLVRARQRYQIFRMRSSNIASP